MVRLINIEKHHVEGPIDKLEVRGQDVTASVAAALPGINAHPYVSPRKLFLVHSGIVFPELNADNPVFWRGQVLEPAVAEGVRKQRPDLTIIKNEYYYRDPELRLGATPDFHVIDANGKKGILQTKTAAPSVFERDWRNGEEIPLWIILQVTIERMLTEAEFALVAVMKVDAFDLQIPILEVPHHPAAEEKIITAVKQFWDDVANGREPDADYAKDASLLPIIAAHAVKDKTIDLSSSNELPALLEQREQLKNQIKAYTDRVEQIDTELKFKILDASRAIIPGWNVTWKEQHRDEYTVAAKDFRVLRITRNGER